MPGVSQPLMPQGHRSSSSGESLVRSAKRVEFAAAVTSEHLRPGTKILDREARGVKLDRHIVITSQTANANQIFDKARANKNISQFERRGGSGNECLCLMRDRQSSTITHCDNGG